MRKRTVKIILATVAVVGVLGVGVAVAATNPPSWAGHGPYATNAASATQDAVRDRVRARDGTGPHHPRPRTALGAACACATALAHGTISGRERRVAAARIARIETECGCRGRRCRGPRMGGPRICPGCARG